MPCPQYIMHIVCMWSEFILVLYDNEFLGLSLTKHTSHMAAFNNVMGNNMVTANQYGTFP